MNGTIFLFCTNNLHVISSLLAHPSFHVWHRYVPTYLFSHPNNLFLIKFRTITSNSRVVILTVLCNFRMFDISNCNVWRENVSQNCLKLSASTRKSRTPNLSLPWFFTFFFSWKCFVSAMTILVPILDGCWRKLWYFRLFVASVTCSSVVTG